MQMSYERFFKLFTGILVIIFTCFAGLNYYFDFFDVFDTEKKIAYGAINDRYVKLSYLVSNPQKYDSVIFGSSRIKKIDASLFSDKCYNVGYDSGDGINEWLRDIKTLIKNDVKLKNIYLGLDDNSYKGYAAKIWDGVRWIPYQNDFENLKYKAKLLVQIPDFGDIKSTIRNSNKDQSVTKLGTTGTLVIPRKVDRDIEDNIQQHISHNKFLKPTYTDDANEHIDESICNLKEIVKICDMNGINLVVFINPVHITTYLRNDIKLFNDFKREVSYVTDYYDFCDINFITTNSYFWYETSHPRYFTGEYIVNRICNKNLDRVPEDFGKFITRENVEQYLADKLSERNSFLLSNHKQYVPQEIDKFKFQR